MSDLKDPKQILKEMLAKAPKADPATNPILAKFNEVMDTEIKPGDEQKYNPNFQNWLVDRMNLPQNWRVNAADEKSFYAGLPEQMGSSTMGSVKKAQQIAAKMPKVVANEALPVLNTVTGKVANRANFGTAPNHGSIIMMDKFGPGNKVTGVKGNRFNAIKNDKP